MDIQEALKIISNAVGRLQADLQTHQVLQQAMQTITAEVNKVKDSDES